MISPAASSTLPTDPTRAAMAGFADAQAVLQGAAEAVATSGGDPAVILDVRQAEVTASVSAAVMKADQQNFKRLLDMFA